MGLKEYNEKRDFKQTAEPKGEPAKHRGELRFVVQRHGASTLHYDFRLEMEGVLKSWAVRKGPSMNPGDKRLAMQVEDHPYSYRTFEGVIPEGNYGAGMVEIWDEGTYHAVEEGTRAEQETALLEGLKRGRLRFVLGGKKLKGEFALVQMKFRGEGAWLLMKKEDAFATADPYDSEEHISPDSKIPREIRKPKKPKATAEAKTASKARTPKKPATAETRTIDGKKVTLTNLDKLYWPDEGYTKGDLADYYQSVAGVLLPYLKDRPQSLLRNPAGITGHSFFQKDVDVAPDWVKRVAIHSESTNEDVDYLVCQDAATLAFMNNMGCIQLNPWSSRLGQLENPDFLVIDLDPGENTYDEVVEVALAAKSVMDAAGISVYPKTSGATGMHLYVPLGAKYAFSEVKKLALKLAKAIHAELPKLTSLARDPKARQKLIYIDYLQNAIGQTIAAPYSVRPRPGAPVSTPLQWKEVKPGLNPLDFTIKNTAKRLKKWGDLFQPVLDEGIDLAVALKKVKVKKT
jgi:DNA ligase D-like protein (predicted polymerase)/DNA ligase D-like protein (predicted 3'-phosphoesterase)